MHEHGVDGSIEGFGHVWQRFDDDESLVAELVDFVEEGERAGERVLVVATHAHIAALKQRTSVAFLPVNAEHIVGGLTDQDGVLHCEHFDRMFGDPIRALTARGPIRVYGELVGILWGAGRVADLVQVERWWNRLRESTPFTLYCGYPATAAELDPEIAALHHAELTSL